MSESLLPQRYPAASLQTAPTRLVIGPANSAGQGFAWARAAERHIAGVAAQSVAVNQPFDFPVDLHVPPAAFRTTSWGRAMQRRVLDQATHVMFESMRPLLGTLNGLDCRGDLRVLARSGVQAALVAHGSDVRLPSRHAQLYPWSPFVDPSWRMTRTLEYRARRNMTIAEEFHDGPVFVSTPDLLDFVPGAQWLPTVIDPSAWHSDLPLLRRPQPLVLHAPSSGPLKGSSHIDSVLLRLEAEGLLRYLRVDRVPHSEMPGLVAQSDIVVEQVVLGLYSLAAVEAMAAGRVVVANVHPRVRERLPRPLPVVDADPGNLEEVMRHIVADRERHVEIAAKGPEYVAAVHDGRRSAEVLGGWLRAGR